MKVFVLFVLAFAVMGAPKNAAAQTINKPVAKLNHIAMYVADLKKSTDFYQSLFNLELAAEPFHDGKHTWFSLGNGAHLHIVQGATAKANYYKNDHLCFSVPSVEVFVKELNTQNIKFENVAGKVGEITARVDGVKQIYFQDPDGHWLEVNDAK